MIVSAPSPGATARMHECEAGPMIKQEFKQRETLVRASLRNKSEEKLGKNFAKARSVLRDRVQRGPDLNPAD